MSAGGRPLRVALLFGTRPEAIKLAPVYLELARRPGEFEPLVWVSAQHREMLDQVLQVFGLVPDRDFDIMRAGQSLTQVTNAVLEATGEALAVSRPDALIVQGDTTTAFARALAAFYAGVPVAHVEAGLRTGDKRAPFPEEINRRMISTLADLHFAPTERARESLLREGVPGTTVWVTGNTVIDALATVSRRMRDAPPPEELPEAVACGVRRVVLVTGHRRESFGEGFESICRAIAALAARFADVEFVYPVHLNPQVREPVYRLLGGRGNVHLIEPLDYRPFVWLMQRAHVILTDSGGIQEEAPFLGKPVLVMRGVTERPEAIEAGTARLVGTDAATIERETARLLEDEAAYRQMSRAHNPFGDGRAGVRIADVLRERLQPGG